MGGSLSVGEFGAGHGERDLSKSAKPSQKYCYNSKIDVLS